LDNNQTLLPLQDPNELAEEKSHSFAQPVQPIAEEYPSNNISACNPSFSEATERVETMNESNREFDITTASEWNEQGNSHLKAGSYNEAINAYTKAIELADDLRWPYIKNLALAHYHIGKIRGRSSANQPEDPDIWEGDDEQAEIKNINGSVDIPAAQRYDVDPNEADGIKNKPEILIPHENNTTPPEVNEDFREGITSQTASDWNELGNSYTRKRMFDEAINAYKTAITLDPKYGSPYSNLGILYQQLGKHQIAVQLYKKSIDLLDNPNDQALSLYRLGSAYRRIHEYALARDAYRKAMEMVPASTNLLMRARSSLLDNVARS
jgi:tetratricopeptide (TPR) repeat protein